MTSPLLLTQGIDTGYAWPIVDEDGQPADLTGWTVKAQVRERESAEAPLLFDFTTAIINHAAVISWTAAESLAWRWGRGYYDVLLVDPQGVPAQVIAQGQVTVDPVVTRIGG